MRNSVILIDQVRTEMEEGRDAWNAIVDAALHRTRPVVLTAAATVLAMIPLTRSVFWGPMALAIMGGLTIATVLTIFFVNQPHHRHDAAGRPMNNFNLTEWALGHRAVVLFLIIVVSIAGVFSFSKLGQLEDPKFSVPSMTATVIWPGASAQQIQDEVLNRMEKKFEQLDHFEKVVTFARQGYGGMTITVKGGTSHNDQQEAWYQARKKFSDLKLELPEASSARSSTTSSATSTRCSMPSRVTASGTPSCPTSPRTSSAACSRRPT